MKRLLILLAFLALTVPSFAQTCATGTYPITSWGVTRDTTLGNQHFVICQDSAGQIYLQGVASILPLMVDGICYATNAPGADLGAKINACDALIGAGAGEIWVTGAGIISTAVNLSAGHDLYFTQDVYTLNAAINLGGSNHLRGVGMTNTILQAGVALASMITGANNDRITVSDMSLDGDSLATELLTLTRAPEAPSEHRVSSVRFNAPAAGGTGLNLNGAEDSVTSNCLFEAMTTGVYPDLDYVATAIKHNITTGDGEMYGNYVYGETELGAQNYSIRGGLLAGIRAVDNIGVLTIVGTQIVPLGTKNMFEVVTTKQIGSLILDGAYLIGVRGVGSFFNSVGIPKGTWTYDVHCRGCSFNVVGGAGVTPLFGADFTATFTPASPPILTFFGGSIGVNITETYPAAAHGRRFLVGFPGGTNRILYDDLITSTFVSITASPATGGAVRLASGDTIYSRNAADGADIPLIKANVFDQIEIGQAATGTSLFNPNFGTTTLTWTGLAFAALGAPANGTFIYCTDCTKATPCAAAGPGALAKRLAGAWDCD